MPFKKIILFVSLFVSLNLFCMAQDAYLTEEQKTAIALVNYFSTVQEEITSHRKNKAYLDELYSNLMNYTKLSSLDDLSKDKFVNTMNAIHEYGMIDTKRERLEFLLENQKSQAIKSAVPNPLSVMNVVKSGNWITALISVTTMAIDSAVSYDNAKNQAELEFLQKGWELDDEESNKLHESITNELNYIWAMLKTYNIEDVEELRLNENDIKKFVDNKFKAKADGTPDYIARKLFFESAEAKKKYSGYAPYYLALVEIYYQTKEYKKCLDSLEKYEQIQGDIFRKDFELARAIPMAISAAFETYSENEYIKYCEKYLKKLEDNTETSNWDLRYFAAQIYISLASISENPDFFSKAYELTKLNVLTLKDVQSAQNKNYLSDLKEPKKSKSNNKQAEKKEKEKFKSEKEYFKFLQRNRKKELPPISEPMLLNCQLLFALFDKAPNAKIEEREMKNILNGIFINSQVNNNYSLIEQMQLQFMTNTALNEVIANNNQEIKKHTDGFKNAFYSELAKEYTDSISKATNINTIGDLNKVLQIGLESDDITASWNSSNEMELPAKYISDNASIFISIYSKEGKIEFEDVPFSVIKVSRKKNNKIEDIVAKIKFDKPSQPISNTGSKSIKNETWPLKYDKKKSYTILVDIKVGDGSQSFVFVKNKSLKLTSSSNFKQLNSKLLNEILKNNKFDFPESKGTISKQSNFGEDIKLMSPEFEEILLNYIISSNKKLSEYSLAFQKAFVLEYKASYYATLQQVLAITDQFQLIKFLRAAYNSNKLSVSLNNNTLNILANEILSGFTLDVKIIDDTGVEVLNITDIDLSIKKIKTEKKAIQNSIANIKITDKRFTGFKFKKNSMYKIYFSVRKTDDVEEFVILRADNGKPMTCVDYTIFKLKKKNEK